MTKRRGQNSDDLAFGCLLCSGDYHRRSHVWLVVCSGATVCGTGHSCSVLFCESGIVSEGSAQIRLSVKFYLVAFFVVFDLEAVFILLWAVESRTRLGRLQRSSHFYRSSCSNACISLAHWSARLVSGGV